MVGTSKVISIIGNKLRQACSSIDCFCLIFKAKPTYHFNNLSISVASYSPTTIQAGKELTMSLLQPPAQKLKTGSTPISGQVSQGFGQADLYNLQGQRL